jgi:hypothetical protein
MSYQADTSAVSACALVAKASLPACALAQPDRRLMPVRARAKASLTESALVRQR